jgi:hypothetical protein
MFSCEGAVDRCFPCLLCRGIARQQHSMRRSSRHSAVSSIRQRVHTVPLTLRLALRQRDAIVARFTERVGSLRSCMSASENTPRGGIVASAGSRRCSRNSCSPFLQQKGGVRGEKCSREVVVSRESRWAQLLSEGPFREVCQQTGRHHSNQQHSHLNSHTATH